jgi:methionyl-tRNA formyltransferase
MDNYVVATIKSWNIDAYEKNSRSLPGHWHLLTNPEALTAEYVNKLAPKYIFFPHWSSIVPREILSMTNCVCFHASDVPYGRGGSPIQNLISRGVEETKLSALKMTEEIDAGPVYLKVPLSLTGRAQDVFESMAQLTWSMIEVIVKTDVDPVPQLGRPVVFRRRKPSQSKLPKEGSLLELYNHIRMLDADTYPRAFLPYGDFSLELSHAELREDSIGVRVSVRKKKIVE